MFLSVLLGMLAYTITTLHNDKLNALLIDMAGRQRMLFQKHIHEVFLTSQGVPSDFASTRQLMHSTLNALIEGGWVVLNPETDRRQLIPAAPTQQLSQKLREQQKHVDHIIQLTDHFLLLSPDHPEYQPQLQTVRTQHALGIKIADEAVKELDLYSVATITTMVKWEVLIACVVGLLGLFVTSKGVRDGRKLEKEVEEKKRAESAVRNSELFVNSIVENIPHMIFVKEAQDLHFVRINKAGEKLLGFSRNTMLGKTDYDFFPKSEADFYTTKDREVLAGKILLDIPEEVIQPGFSSRNLLRWRLGVDWRQTAEGIGPG
jgi:PAS domain-containing protein